MAEKISPPRGEDHPELIASEDEAGRREADPLRRANSLDGRDWTRFSISVWSDIGWTPEERALKHPAKFPVQLVERILQCFMRPNDLVVLDPFMGSGSAMVAASNLGKDFVGFEVYQDYIDLAHTRVHQKQLFIGSDKRREIHKIDARQMNTVLQPDSVDVCITSPPYWDILLQKRTADSKEVRHYGSQIDDLGRIDDYPTFLDEIQKVFQGVYDVLRPGKYCVVNVMDLRKGATFYCYHRDLASRLEAIGFVFDDIIIWDRRKDYNNMRALGFPYTFRINKAHEYLLIFLKPGDKS